MIVGILAGRVFGYDLYRREVVWVISAAGDAGCSGGAGAGYVYLGMYGGTADGAYHLDCGDRERVGVDVQLICDCSNNR